jgi:hypothetical protein
MLFYGSGEMGCIDSVDGRDRLSDSFVIAGPAQLKNAGPAMRAGYRGDYLFFGATVAIREASQTSSPLT